jgi:hypothetical protein
MKEISFLEAIVPPDVIIKAALSGFNPSSLRHFLCPDDMVGCTVSIRTKAEELQEMRRRSNLVVN